MLGIISGRPCRIKQHCEDRGVKANSDVHLSAELCSGLAMDVEVGGKIHPMDRPTLSKQPIFISRMWIRAEHSEGIHMQCQHLRSTASASRVASALE